MAALDNDSTPTKRALGRASPPKFASSTSSSPVKEEAKSSWSNSSPSKPSNVFGGPKNISTPDLSASSLGKPIVSPGSSSTATTPTKKFTPVWKRTIPDYPAPVFGYAAGMVADPFAKPNASSTSVSSSPSKSNETPKVTKVLTEKERKKLEKEEKKKAKEEEKQRKKLVKRGIAVPPTTGNASAAATPVRQPASVSANKPSPSQLPYLNPTPPRVGAPGEYSKAYAHGQLQHQHLMARGGVIGYGQGQQTSSQQSTPTRQIQVRGQPVQASASGTPPSGAVTRYSMPLAKQESSTEEDEEAEGDDEDDESDQDVEQAYQYEGSDYSEETSEQEYAVPMSRKAREQKQREEEERQYQEYLAQQQRAKEKAKKAGGSSPGRYQGGYERPSPTSRHGHVKSRSSASDGFVVVSQSQPSGRNGSRPAHSRTQSYHTNYSNSEDDWEQLQSYEASPEKFKATPTPKSRAKGKGRRYQEPSEEEEEEEDEEEEEEEEAQSAEEELRRRYMAKRKWERAQAKAQAEAEAQKQAEAEAQAREQARGSRHRREASERETVRKFQREPEYEYEADPRVQNSTAKQSMQGRGMREKVQDIDWGRQEQPQDQNAPRKYQQQLKYDGGDDDGRGREKTKVKRRASLKELFRSRSKSRSRYAEPEEEEEEDYSRQKVSSSPTKKPSQPTRTLVKKGSRKVMVQ
ncbi:hypothetical protein FA13DRAFT_70098 [Coprinellus micaceus]|uniref:Uncharacterized protein n=1 Tax=Coprinellus micaceus TaxID=71717 RepID=A0A4Y7TJM5_COPMI|nr:hypothetical protein FA13DRAFT_70098 [Coprinellus micaceus]